MRWSVILLAFAFVASSCVNDSPEASTERSGTRPQWSPPGGYTYEVASSCGERNFIGRFRVHVHSGDVQAVTALDQPALSAVVFGLEVPTLEMLLAEASEAEGAGADRVEIRRGADGTPERIEIDHDTNAIDDEACYVIRRFASAVAARPPTATDGAIYSAVARRLMRDASIGRSDSRLEELYVVDGAMSDAGRPRGDVAARPRRPFESSVMERIQQALAPHVWPTRWVGNLGVALPGSDGSVGNNKAVLLLGRIERRGDDEALVPVTWWCDKCSRWLTYALVNKDGRWVVTGTTGRVTIS
jgi:hypothetical protein